MRRVTEEYLKAVNSTCLRRDLSSTTKYLLGLDQYLVPRGLVLGSKGPTPHLMGARLLHEWFLYTNFIAEASLKTFSSASTMFLEGRPVFRVYLINLF